jgi:hypothetical protein
LHASLLADLNCYLEDTADAWLLQSDGTYRHAAPPADGSAPVSAQASQLKRYSGYSIIAG